MKKLGTYEELLTLERDIATQKKNSPAFAAFNSEKINRFYQQNAVRLDVAKGKLQKMIEEHVYCAAGEFKKIMENGKFVKWNFLTQADEEEYNAKYEALMKAHSEIIL